MPTNPDWPELVEGRPFCLAEPMPFWAYMLHCRDRTLYVGHTDDLETRVAQHQDGSYKGYTARKLPVALVWSQEFATRHEAKTAELQIKGWRKEKKLALIRGDWDQISRLARARKGRPSTSSGQSDLVEGEALVRQPRAEPGVEWLHPHLSSLPSEPFALEVAATLRNDGLRLRFRLTGPIDLLNVPGPGVPERAEGLWQSLCFEAFVRPCGSPAYFEINLAPSRRWAAYRFQGRREGMAPVDIPEPRVQVDKGQYALEVSAILQLPADLAGAAINLAAVIEEKSGHRSYWALAHPPSGPPDFHDPACFVLELPPAPAE
jgi:predicted GIY-YIG superfamily endonuclease